MFMAKTKVTSGKMMAYIKEGLSICSANGKAYLAVSNEVSKTTQVLNISTGQDQLLMFAPDTKLTT